MPFSFRGDLILPDHIRKSLGKVFGKLIQTRDLGVNIEEGDRIFAVGDIVVGTLLKEGFTPSVAIFDNRTARGRISVSAIRRRFRSPLKARNRPGSISRELWNAVDTASKSSRPVGIRVYGEEDLASLACIHFAPMNSIVVYGIRGRGIDIIRVRPGIKRFAERVLRQMRDESGGN
jgi:uncharacterized protein (UPF0218 family)